MAEADDLPEDASRRFRRLAASQGDSGAEQLPDWLKAGEKKGPGGEEIPDWLKSGKQAAPGADELPDWLKASPAASQPEGDELAETLPMSAEDATGVPAAAPPAAPELDDTAPVKIERPPEKPLTTDETLPASVSPSKPVEQPTRPSAPYDRQTEPRKPVPAQNQALPRPVSEVDLDATRVSSSAYTPQQRTPGGSLPPIKRPANSAMPSTIPAVPKPTPAAAPTAARRVRPRINWRKGWGCLLRGAFISLFIMVMAALCGVSFLFYEYYKIASTLPDINDLSQRASQFETTRILDRNGNILYEILDPNAGRRTYVPLKNISPYLVAATIATEDSGFYSHPGFDIFAIARALWQNYQSGTTISGASTITQQLARNLLFSPEERVEQSYDRKVREAILAAEITRRYSKDEILELYLNENNYGNLAYGIQAAAETYFGKTAADLTLGEAAFLAGLPQAPAIYDVYTNPEATFSRMEDVLVLMYDTSQESGCIQVSNSPTPVCLDPVAVTEAATQVRNLQFQSPDIEIRHPHWVNYVRALLETQYDPQAIYRSGFTVYTTLDPSLQDQASQALSEQLSALAAQNATNGAVVVIRPTTGEILAMVGSADFYNAAISGQVNMAVSPRQPGSTIKPFTYLAAFEKGWTPASLLWDVPSEFTPSGQPNDPMPPYIPINYDERFHGPVTMRMALANSYNIPAVKTLQFAGIYDDPNTPVEDGLLAMMRRLGVNSLTRPDYGLSLTLGGGDVSLLELTNAYAVLANQGRLTPLVAITRILDHKGSVVYDYKPSAGDQVVRAEHAYLLSSILADNEARTPAFGANSVLHLPFDVAVKTGTTNDYRDNWTIGYNPDAVVGVWVGNADYTPMQNTSGLTGAAPVWSVVMQTAVQQVTGGSPSPFVRPPGIVDYVICSISGTQPSQWCPQQRSEIFAADQPPLPKEQDLWQKIMLDTWTGLAASQVCADFTDEVGVINVQDKWAKKWVVENPQGRAWSEEMGFPDPVIFAPERECRADDPRPVLAFMAPRENDLVLQSPVSIYGVADATQGFQSVSLEFGFGDKPVEWQVLAGGRQAFPRPELLHTWDVDRLPSGRVTLRLTMQSEWGTFAKTLLHIDLLVPTPTPIPTATPVPTATPTNTPFPTATPTIFVPFMPTPTPTFFVPFMPTNTPVP